MPSQKFNITSIKRSIFRITLRRILFTLLVVCILVGAWQPVFAQVNSGSNYYVSTNGSDINPGTESQPWRTIQKAVNTVNPGDKIYIMQGTYSESITIQRTGTSSNPITLTNYNGQVATINGGANAALIPHTSAPQYWVIEGLRLLSSGTFTVNYDSWGCDGTCDGIDHWTFRNNYISGAIRIYGSYTLFEGNEVDGTQNNGNGGNAVWDLYDVSHNNIFRNNFIHNFSRRGIWSMHRTHDNIFENNVIQDISSNNDGICIDADGFGTVEWRHSIRNNQLSRCGNIGIALENVFASTVENNVIHDTIDKGVYIVNYGPNNPGDTSSPKKCEAGGENNQYGDTDSDNDCEGNITGNKIRQNLIYRGGTDAGIRIRYAGGVEIYANTVGYGSGKGIALSSGVIYCPQISIRNNVLAQNHDQQISLKDLSSLSTDDHNLFFTTNPLNTYAINTSTYSLADYQAVSGQGVGSIYGDPQFTDPNSDNFHPKKGGASIDSGVNIGISSDLDGNPRPQGNGFDIGPYEVKPATEVKLFSVCIPIIRR